VEDVVAWGGDDAGIGVRVVRFGADWAVGGGGVEVSWC
jgi:hypothetical protein